MKRTAPLVWKGPLSLYKMFILTLIFNEAVVAHKRAIVNAAAMDSIPTRGNEIFNIFIPSLQ